MRSVRRAQSRRRRAVAAVNMSYEIIETEQAPIKAWTHGVPIEEQAKQQLRNVAALPFLFKHLAVMPDVHWGKGATVRSRAHLGTLGTGNHFIELCLDEDDRVWVMLHSGSRGIGNAIGSYFIERAQEDMRRHMVNLPDRDLAYLSEDSENFADYVE